MRLKCVSISYPPPESPRIPRGSLKCTFMRLKCVSIGLSSAGVAAHPPARVSIAHLCVSNVSQSGFPPPESPRIPPPESQMHIHASQMRLNRAFLRRSRRASPRRSLKCTFMRLKCVSIGISSAGVAAHPPAGVSNVSQLGYPPPESPRIPPPYIPRYYALLNLGILYRILKNAFAPD